MENYTMNPPQQPIQIQMKMLQQPSRRTTSVRPTSSRSSWLIKCGVVEVVASTLLFIWCVCGAAAIQTTIYSSYFGLACALFHIIVGIVAIVGGYECLRYRSCIVGLLVLSIGASLFGLATFVTLIINWDDNNRQCSWCEDNTIECPDICDVGNPAILYVPFLILLLIECVVGIILSGISCYRTCSCCYCCDAQFDDTASVALHVIGTSHDAAKDNVQLTLLSQDDELNRTKNFV
uniref:Uncharacterized protein n=1 Tax=Strigamia maritima TaxID=126957 RepID=T1IWN4_STRMM